MMETDPGFTMPELTHDCYDFAVHHGPVIHWRPTMVSTRLPWRYVGVLHEYLECDGRFDRAPLEGVRMVIVGGGGRLQGSERKKYLRDAAILKDGLAKEPDNARYAFYLAQSWRDADEPAKALAAYDRRAAMDGFAEEAFCARPYAARLARTLKRKTPEVMRPASWRPTSTGPPGPNRSASSPTCAASRGIAGRSPTCSRGARRRSRGPTTSSSSNTAGTTGRPWTNWRCRPTGWARTASHWSAASDSWTAEHCPKPMANGSSPTATSPATG
ncbi:hypothetical protein AB0G67_06790 [Streptomyces sp. NPDC021056]|uniref:tetratricopeptide repeat protein n=1 Tax=Streptomyces sp. NPDC021056 TaxID=3155012 RepID=UPI0033F68AB0